MSLENMENVVPLSDGTVISFDLYGCPSFAKPIFYFHGIPGSRVEARYTDNAAKKLGLTIVALDRPGFGLSTPRHGRCIEDWPSRVIEFADKKGIDKFAIVAISGGCPYALACAATIPADRLLSTTVISGLGEIKDSKSLAGMCFPNKFLLLLTKYHPVLAKGFISALGYGWRFCPSCALFWLKIIMPKADKKLLSTPWIKDLFLQNVEAALRQGPKILCDELRAVTSEWRFNLSECQSLVYIWHGESDDYVPPSMSRALGAKLKSQESTFIPGQGHFMALEFIERILANCFR